MTGRTRSPILDRCAEVVETCAPLAPRALGRWWLREVPPPGVRGERSRIARSSLVVISLGLAGCVGFSSRVGREPAAPAPPGADEAKDQVATLIGAHVLLDAPAPAFPAPGQDELHLVVAQPLDPTSISADAFLVLGADGRRVSPGRVVLAPADEQDEGRALTLLGDFGDGSPTDVRVVGPLRGEDGRSLRGEVVSVWPLWAPVRLLLAYPVPPAAGRCAGSVAAIRTWWSQPIASPLSDGQAVRFVVHLADGREIAPRTIDDHTHAPPGRTTAQPRETDSTQIESGVAGADEAVVAAASPDDAVLDLCFDQAVGAGSLDVPAGVVIGRTGRAAEAQSLPLVDAAAASGG